MTDSQTIKLFGLANDSIVDGPGLRFSVFVQGCSHRCQGCHNPESQPYEGGTSRLVSDLAREILDNKLISGVTLSGGEPFDQAEACALLAGLVKEANLSIWTYTGYLYENLLASNRPGVQELLAVTDVLVDGPFVQAKQSYLLAWRGSSNQRLIDMNKTREANEVVLWTEPTLSFAKPDSW